MNRPFKTLILFVGVIASYWCLHDLPAAMAQSVSNGNSPVRQNRPITFGQIEALVKGTTAAKPTPDEIIAQEILERSVEFQVDDEMLGNLSAMGAGRQTLDALKQVRNRILRAGTTTVVVHP